MQLELITRLSLGTATVGATVGAWLLHRRTSKYAHAARCYRLLNRLNSSKQVSPPLQEQFTFAEASTEVAFTEICQTSAEVYGDDNVNPEITRKWWSRFPHAVFAAYSRADDDLHALAAYVSIWPLSCTAYRRFRQGNMREADISAHSIRKSGNGETNAYWYVSNIVIHKRYQRRPHLLKELLVQAMKHWATHGQLDHSLSLLSAAYSKEGEAMLRRFGFRPLAERTPDGWRLYEVQVTCSEVADLLKLAIGEKV
jgi:hypothetical protein